MKTFALAATAAAALLATSASAATFADPWTSSPDGGISVVFGDNGLGTAGAENVPNETTTTHAYNASTGEFTDTFAFQLPSGQIGFTLSSIGFQSNSTLQLTSFTWNGFDVDFTNVGDSNGGGVMSLDGPFPVVAGGPQVLTVKGTGGAQAVFDGTATFSRVAAVPEPATWGLMILGFGGAGAMLRRRRERLAWA